MTEIVMATVSTLTNTHFLSGDTPESLAGESRQDGLSGPVTGESRIGRLKPRLNILRAKLTSRIRTDVRETQRWEVHLRDKIKEDDHDQCGAGWGNREVKLGRPSREWSQDSENCLTWGSQSQLLSVFGDGDCSKFSIINNVFMNKIYCLKKLLLDWYLFFKVRQIWECSSSGIHDYDGIKGTAHCWRMLSRAALKCRPDRSRPAGRSSPTLHKNTRQAASASPFLVEFSFSSFLWISGSMGHCCLSRGLLEHQHSNEEKERIENSRMTSPGWLEGVENLHSWLLINWTDVDEIYIS